MGVGLRAVILKFAIIKHLKTSVIKIVPANTHFYFLLR